MNESFFSGDYFESRSRFVRAATQLDWRIESHSIEAMGPGGEVLFTDVAVSGDDSSDATLVVSSGLHGVEGFVGAAIQLAWLDRLQRQEGRPIRCVFIHALNPYGFAWLRRFDHDNVDPNRNFLLNDESYCGAPDGYSELDSLLNPSSPAKRLDRFYGDAALAIARHGMPKLRQIIAGGQYEFPRGLFYGGSQPSTTQRFVSDHWRRLLGNSESILHLDFHSGLGQYGNYLLLLEPGWTPTRLEQFAEHFGSARVRCEASGDAIYATRGSFGRWLAEQFSDRAYQYACVEFGTYHSVRMLAGLRRENRSHHFGPPTLDRHLKRKLLELFCPRAATWRQRVLQQSDDLLHRSLAWRPV